MRSIDFHQTISLPLQLDLKPDLLQYLLYLITLDPIKSDRPTEHLVARIKAFRLIILL